MPPPQFPSSTPATTRTPTPPYIGLPIMQKVDVCTRRRAVVFFDDCVMTDDRTPSGRYINFAFLRLGVGRSRPIEKRQTTSRNVNRQYDEPYELTAETVPPDKKERDITHSTVRPRPRRRYHPQQRW